MRQSWNWRYCASAAMSIACSSLGLATAEADELVVTNRAGVSTGPQTSLVTDGSSVTLVQCPPAARRRVSYEPIRTVFRKLSWHCNSNHAHLLHQSCEPYWLPHGGYHETIWTRDLAAVEQPACPCPTLINVIEEEGQEVSARETVSPPTLVAPPLPGNVPAATPSGSPPSEPYSPSIRPNRAGG